MSVAVCDSEVCHTSPPQNTRTKQRPGRLRNRKQEVSSIWRGSTNWRSSPGVWPITPLPTVGLASEQKKDGKLKLGVILQFFQSSFPSPSLLPQGSMLRWCVSLHHRPQTFSDKLCLQTRKPQTECHNQVTCSFSGFLVPYFIACRCELQRHYSLIRLHQAVRKPRAL